MFKNTEYDRYVDEKSEKVIVRYEGGESRENPGAACDYMIAKIPDGFLGIDAPFMEDHTEIYAEVVLDESLENAVGRKLFDEDGSFISSEDECVSYSILREMVLGQAKEMGINEEQICFQEDIG